jgi:hypothetical protein
MTMIYSSYLTNTLNCIFIVLVKQHSVGRHVAVGRHATEKGQTTIYKTLHRKTIDRVTRTPLKKYFNIVVDLWIYCTGSSIILQFSFHYVCNMSGHVCIKIVDIKFSMHLLIALYLTFYYLSKLKYFFSGVCVTRSIVFCVVFCRLLFVLFLLAFDLRILITPLVSSNSSS